MITKTLFKEYVKAQGLKMSGDVPEEMDNKIKYFIDIACERAKANERKTLFAKDL